MDYGVGRKEIRTGQEEYGVGGRRSGQDKKSTEWEEGELDEKGTLPGELIPILSGSGFLSW